MGLCVAALAPIWLRGSGSTRLRTVWSTASMARWSCVSLGRYAAWHVKDEQSKRTENLSVCLFEHHCKYTFMTDLILRCYLCHLLNFLLNHQHFPGSDCQIKRSAQFLFDSRALNRKETADVQEDAQPPLFCRCPCDTPLCFRRCWHINTQTAI